MKKFITLLLLCLTGMAAWAADIENVALKTDAGSYLAGTSDAIAMSTTAQRFTLKPVEGGTGAHQLLNTDLACWVNSGSNGYLSYAPQSQMNNARYFYFYEVLSTSTTTSLTAILSTTPKVGKKYVIVVKNENGGTTSGFYAIYGQWASGKTNRLDVVKKLSDTAPTMVSLSTSNESSTGAIDLAKVVWTLEVPTKECPECGETVPEDCAVCPIRGYVFEAAPAGPTGSVVKTYADAGTPMSYSDFLALSGTGKHFGLMAVSSDALTTYHKWFGFTSATSRVSELTKAQLFTLSGTTNNYTVTRVSSNTAAQSGMKIVNRTAGDYAPEYTSAMSISFDNASGGHFNANSYAFAGGTGGWSAYVAYGPFYVATIEIEDIDGNVIQEATEQIVTEGYIPDVPGRDYVSGEAVTADGTYTFVFSGKKFVDYTVSVSGAVGGAVEFEGNQYGNEEKITASGLTEDQLTAVPVAGYISAVTIEGTTITVTYTAIPYTFETSQAPVGGVWQNGTKFYSIKEKRAGYFYASLMPDIKSQTSAPTTDDGKWAVIANGSYFQFMNKATQEVLTFASTANDALASMTDDLNDPNSLFDVVTYKNSKFEAGYECFTIANAVAYPNDKGTGLAVWNNEQALWGWGYNANNPGNGDDGCKFLFTMVEELTSVTYTVNVVGAPTGETIAVTVKGETVVNNTITLSSTASTADVVATTIAGYTYEVAINGTVITVTYKEQIPTAGKVYTIKAWFRNANPVYLTNAGGTTLTFPASAQGAKSYWVARESNGTYDWKLQSGYGDGRYLDGNASGGGISATGFEIDINEIAGTPYYSMYTNITGKGARYVGTWRAGKGPGFGLYGGAFGTSHSDVDWTTKYIIEPVPNVTAYNVVCATADGGIAPAFTGYTGATNVKAGGVIVVPNDVEINTTNFPVLPVTGYEGSVSASGNTITVTYVMTSIPVDVTYTFTVDGETIGTKTITEFQGEASTVASVIPSYVEATGIPATVEQNAYTIETSYTGLPFEVGKKYTVSIIGGGVQYWLYANASNTVVKESTTKQTGSDYEWTVGGDWLNGFSFVNGSGYYIAAPSATPANGNNTTVTTTDGALTRFDLVQNGTYGYRFMPHGGSNYIAHTSASSKNLGFFDYYGRDASYNSGNSLLFEEAGLEVTIGTTGFATFYDEVDRVIPTDVTAYYCEESVSGYLKPVEITTGVIPAYVGVVLEGTPGNYVLNEGDGTAEYIDESCLDGTTEDFGTQELIDMYYELYNKVTPTIYVFSKKNDVLGFYKYVGTTLGAHKAFYMTVPEAGVNGFILDFEGTEGINSVISATNLKAGYDIQGRRINKIQKGINILNGKKIIK